MEFSASVNVSGALWAMEPIHVPVWSVYSLGRATESSRAARQRVSTISPIEIVRRLISGSHDGTLDRPGFMPATAEWMPATSHSPVHSSKWSVDALSRGFPTEDSAEGLHADSSGTLPPV